MRRSSVVFVVVVFMGFVTIDLLLLIGLLILIDLVVIVSLINDAPHHCNYYHKYASLIITNHHDDHHFNLNFNPLFNQSNSNLNFNPNYPLLNYYHHHYHPQILNKNPS
jgi:hypothetical protein